MLQNDQPRRNFRSFRAAVTFYRWPERVEAGGKRRELIYRAIVERHVGKHTGLPHFAKACPLTWKGWQGWSRHHKPCRATKKAGRADPGESPWLLRSINPLKTEPAGQKSRRFRRRKARQ